MIGDYFTKVGISKLKCAFRNQFPELYMQQKYTIHIVIWCDEDYTLVFKHETSNYIYYYQLHRTDIQSIDSDDIKFIKYVKSTTLLDGMIEIN